MLSCSITLRQPENNAKTKGKKKHERCLPFGGDAFCLIKCVEKPLALATGSVKKVILKHSGDIERTVYEKSEADKHDKEKDRIGTILYSKK